MIVLKSCYNWPTLKKTVVLALIFFLCYLGCVAPAFGVSAKPAPAYCFFAKDNNATVNVALNKIFKLSLQSNPTTGYDWFIVDLDHKAFKIVGSGFLASKTKLVGAAGVRWWKVKALKKGKHSLALLYYRPWEGSDKAASKYTLNIIVK